MARDSPDSPLTSPKDSSYFLIVNHEFSCAPDLKIQKLSRAYVQELFWKFQFTYVRARKFFFFFYPSIISLTIILQRYKIFKANPNFSRKKWRHLQIISYLCRTK